MSVNPYVLLVGVWVIGFAAGYLLRSYVSYRHRRSAWQARYTLPAMEPGVFSHVPDGDLSTLVPGDRPTRSDKGAAERDASDSVVA